MCPFAGVSRCTRFRDGRNWSLLARRLRALTAGRPLCPDELKAWSKSVALIRQELVFGERRSLKTDGPPAGKQRNRHILVGHLVAQAIDSHILLELELLLLAPVASCSE